MHLHPISILFLLVVGIVCPALVLVSVRQLQSGLEPDRARTYLSTFVLSTALLALAALTARADDLPVFGVFELRIRSVLVVVGWLGAKLAYLAWNLRAGALDKASFVRVLAPRSSRERAAWLVLVGLAAFSEEIVYRAVLFGILRRLLGDFWLAASLGALLFGVVHLLQGVRGALMAVVFGFLSQVVLLATGSLWYVIASHFIYDLIAGWVIGSRFANEAPATEVEPPPATEVEPPAAPLEGP